MANGGAVAGAAAGAAAVARAIKASGVVVRVSPEDFQRILARATGALVVHAEGGLFTTRYKYLIGYRGLAFFTKASEPLHLPAHVETVQAAKIWIPG